MNERGLSPVPVPASPATVGNPAHGFWESSLLGLGGPVLPEQLPLADGPPPLSTLWKAPFLCLAL